MPMAPISDSARSGLQFEVHAFTNYLKKSFRYFLFNTHDFYSGSYRPRYTQIKQSPKVCYRTAAVSISSITEYLCAEIEELAGNVCDRDTKQINSIDVRRSILNDAELYSLFKNEVIAFDSSLYPSKTSLEKNIISVSSSLETNMTSADFVFNELCCKFNIIESLKSFHIKVSAHSVGALLEYANRLYLKMIEDVDVITPSEKIKNQDLFGLISIHINDNTLDVVTNEFISKDDSSKLKEALIMHFLIKYAIEIILIKAIHLNGHAKAIGHFIVKGGNIDDEGKKGSYVADDKDESTSFLSLQDYDDEDEDVDLDTEIRSCMSCMTITDTDQTRHRTIRDQQIELGLEDEVSAAAGHLYASPHRKIQNKLADLMLTELERSLGGMKILLLEEESYIQQSGTRKKGGDYTLSSGALKFIKLLIDLIFRLIIENAECIAMMKLKKKTKINVKDMHIIQAALMLGLNYPWREKFENNHEVFQETEFLSSLDTTARLEVLNVGRFILNDIIEKAYVRVEHTRRNQNTPHRTCSIHDIIFAITSLDYIDLFELALMKQFYRVGKFGSSPEELLTILMTLCQNGLFRLYPEVIANIGTIHDYDIAVDLIDAPVSIKMKLLSLFYYGNKEVIIDIKRGIKAQSVSNQGKNSSSDLPIDPFGYLLNETLRRQQFSLSTSELPPLLMLPFLELYNVYDNTNLFHYYQLHTDELLIAYKRNVSKPCIVSEKIFNENWKKMSLDVFESIDMTNCFIAGGSILRCLIEDSDITVSSIAIDHKSDIDVFIYGLTLEEAEAKLTYVIDNICKNRKSIAESLEISEPTSMLSISNYAVTLLGFDVFRPIQFVLRLYRTPNEVLQGFDVDSCCVGYDLRYKQVYASPRAWRAIVTRCNTVDISRRSPSYESRLIKYAERGFAIYMGNNFTRREIDRMKVKTAILSGLGKKGFMKLISEDYIQEYKIDRASRPHKINGFQGYFPKSSNYVVPYKYDRYGFFWDMIETYGSRIDKKFACINLNYTPEVPQSEFDHYELYEYSEIRIGNKVALYKKIYSNTQLRTLLTGLNWMIDNPSKQGLLTGSFEPIEFDNDFYQEELWKVHVEDPITENFLNTFFKSLKKRAGLNSRVIHEEGVLEEEFDRHCHNAAKSENEVDINRLTEQNFNDSDDNYLVTCNGVSFLSTLTLLMASRGSMQKVLRQVHANYTISTKAEMLLLALLSSSVYKIVHESLRLMRARNISTLTSKEIESCVRLLMDGELARHAINESSKALRKFRP